MHKKFLLSVFKKTAFWGIIGVLFASPSVLAQAPTSAGGSVFTEALTTLYHTFIQVRQVVYVTAGFGLIGVAVAAIAGKFPWRWLAMIAVALFTLAIAEKIILYITNPDISSIPVSSFETDLTDAAFKIHDGGASNKFDYERFTNNSVSDSNFESHLAQ